MSFPGDQQAYSGKYLWYYYHMPSDNFTTLSMNIPGTGHARQRTGRVAAFLANRFIMVMAIAGYPVRLSHEQGKQDRMGISSDIPGIHTGTKLPRGREIRDLHVDARRVSPAILSYT
jgi:hypothetical protein